MGAEAMKTDKKYWIWLSLVLEPGARTDTLFSSYKNPEEVYNDTDEHRKITGVFTRKQLNRFPKFTLEDAENIISQCEENGWEIVTPDDKIYPAGLRQILDMPLVLYVSGDISCLRGKVMIGVVGTRKPGVEGVKVTHEMCTDISAAGAVIVSGGALGIDSAAHESALYAGGKTVCVLGCGLGTNYLMENEPMRREISKNGAVVTEYPPFAPASRVTFPRRNRIISGMSHAVLVVEAGERSGSLITAKEAMKQRRMVFAVPGSVMTSAYTGANKLLSQGAKAAVNAAEILGFFSDIYPDRLHMELIGTVKYSEKLRETPDGLDPDMKKVYNCLGNEPVSFDDIVALSGLGQTRAVTAIMQLELADIVTETESKKYVIK